MKKLLLALALSAPAFAADVTIKNAWTRPTVPGQPAAAAYFDITASKNVHIIKVETPAASVAEVHDMKNDAKGVMRMRAEPNLLLPAGQTVHFKPSGLHVMMTRLQQQFEEGKKYSMIFTFDDNGTHTQLRVDIPIRKSPPGEG